MPIYEYECTQCGHRTELLQRHGDPPLAKCPQCGGGVRKLFSAPAVQFKGSGWYVTDYAGKGKAPPASEGAASGDKKAKAGKAETASGRSSGPADKTGSKSSGSGD